jgi:hypothetical protein
LANLLCLALFYGMAELRPHGPSCLGGVDSGHSKSGHVVICGDQLILPLDLLFALESQMGL